MQGKAISGVLIIIDGKRASMLVDLCDQSEQKVRVFQEALQWSKIEAGKMLKDGRMKIDVAGKVSITTYDILRP